MDPKVLSLIEEQLESLTDRGFHLSLTKVSISSQYVEEQVTLQRDPVKISISFDEFVDCKYLTLYISRTDRNACFSFDEYFRYKNQDKKVLKGSLKESTEGT